MRGKQPPVTSSRTGLRVTEKLCNVTFRKKGFMSCRVERGRDGGRVEKAKNEDDDVGKELKRRV